MNMKVWKFGIILSLLMVIHALFYPNKYSLIIAIVGYIIALASAVGYGLCKFSINPQKVRVENFDEELIQQKENSVNTIIPRLSFIIPKSDYRFPTFSASKLVNIDSENLLEKILFENQNLGNNDYDTIKEIKDSGLVELIKENQMKKEIPGYQ